MFDSRCTFQTLLFALKPGKEEEMRNTLEYIHNAISRSRCGPSTMLRDTEATSETASNGLETSQPYLVVIMADGTIVRGMRSFSYAIAFDLD